MELTRVTALAVVLLSAVGAGSASAAPLVDCSSARFQQKNSARSLYLWSREADQKVSAAIADGTFQRKSGNPGGVSDGAAYCAKMINYRGTAHCKEPANAEYRATLGRLMGLCRRAAAAPLANRQQASIDCREPRFQRPDVAVPQLLRWTELSLRSLANLGDNETFRIKPICDDAIKHAGTAHCKAPQNPKTQAALDRVRAACAAVRAKHSAAKAKVATDHQASIDAVKARRKLVRFPRSNYRGADSRAIARRMRRAMLGARVAKGANEILRIQPMGSWQSGRYRGTRIPYQRLMGTVLWFDKDNDGVCRYVSYNFVKDKRGGRWSDLRFKSFCNGCPEGWTKCK